MKAFIRHILNFPVDIFKRPTWWLKQWLPLTYRTRFTETQTGKRFFVVWKMWFGECYDIDELVVGE